MGCKLLVTLEDPERDNPLLVDALVTFTVAFLPLLLTAIPLVVFYISNKEEEFQEAATADLPAQFTILCGDLTTPECVQYFVVAEFLLLYLIVPVIIPMTIASYSIVGEKSTRTLEPLLATPITTLELLAGKGLAASIPAVLATWGGFLIFYIGVRMMEVSAKVVSKLFAPLWLLAIFCVGPLLAMAGVSIAVMISSRVNDPRAGYGTDFRDFRASDHPAHAGANDRVLVDR